MYKEKKILCIIPARKGSKRIKWKNIVPLAERPLLEYTINCAVNSKYIDRVVVSTDSYYIKDLAKKMGADTPFLRPKNLATDDAKTIDVLLHALKYCEEVEKEKYDYLVLLQNTSPLRKSWQVDDAIEKIVLSTLNSLISLSEVREHPTLMKKLSNDKRISPLLNNSKKNDYGCIYRINGAIFINKINKNFNSDTILTNNQLPYIMNRETSVDIDTIEDIKIAEYYLGVEKQKKLEINFKGRSMEKLILIGAGGYAKSVIDSVDSKKYEVVGFIDNIKEGHHLGIPIISSSLDDIKNSEDYVYFVSIGDNKKRKYWYEEVQKRNLKIIDVIDKSAILSKNITHGPGLFVGKLAVINSEAHIGENVIINTKALVEHGVHIGNHSNISTNTTVNGDVHIGNQCFIGSSSVINGQIIIGNSCTVGSGTVVIHNVNYGSTVVGVPGKIIKEDEKMRERIFIVAEIGCNHNGDPELAKKMVEIAKECGVDAVKFQTFKADLLISKYAPKAEYQKKVTSSDESQLEMTKKLELPFDKFIELEKYARSLGLEVFSTPFDFESIDFLAGYQQKIWKIPSGEVTNLPYIEKIAKLPIINKQIVLSTGMSTIDEIEETLNILTKNGMKEENITILHCNTEYPTPYEDVNLLSIPYLKEKFPKYKIGFSDHSQGYFDGIAAVPYGITFIEKHFTLDKNFEGPDHKASVLPEELKLLCEGIRAVEKSMGKYKKVVTDSERKNKIVARKSIIAKAKIKKGEIFTEENLTTKRPGNGISPMNWYKILGKRAERDFDIDELIEDSNFKNQGND